MSQTATQTERPGRVFVGAWVDEDKRDQLVAIAKREDCSMSRLLRRALTAELRRQETTR